MPNRRSCYGEHRGRPKLGRVPVFSIVCNRGCVYIPHFRSASLIGEIRFPDGRFSRFELEPLPPGFDLYQSGVKWRLAMALQKRVPAGTSGPQAFTSEPCPLGKRYPSLLAFLTDTIFEDGQVRTPGSVTLFRAAEGGLRVCLSDKDLDEVAFVTGTSLTELLKRTDDGIRDGSLDWRSNKRRGSKK